jgi:predicted RNA polymerase sigma factor
MDAPQAGVVPGLSTPEIARAQLSTEPMVAQHIVLNQDRRLWDEVLIQRGLGTLAQAAVLTDNATTRERELLHQRALRLR